MSVVRELITAIEADPQDVEAQKVIADYLQDEGDPRGELIVLDHLDRSVEITDPEVLERLLLLAAEYSFPRAQPDEPMLAFEVVHDDPLEYGLEHEHVYYRARWAAGELVIRTRYEDDFDDNWPQEGFDLALGARWSDDETRIILTILSDAIRAQTPIGELRFPWDGMPLPTYDGGPLRCYALPVEFVRTRDFLRNRYGLAARDYHRWNFIWRRLMSIEGARR